MYLHRYPLEFYSSDTNEYIRNSVQETEQFNFSVLIALFSLISEVSVVICMLIFLAVIDIRVTIITLLFSLTLTLIFTRLLKKPLETSGESRQRYFGLRLKVLRQALDGYKDLTVANAQNIFMTELVIIMKVLMLITDSLVESTAKNVG